MVSLHYKINSLSSRIAQHEALYSAQTASKEQEVSIGKSHW